MPKYCNPQHLDTYSLEATIGFEPMNQGVADPRLTTWLCRQIAPRVGLEPTTLRLTAECSTIELSRKINTGKTTLNLVASSLVSYHITKTKFHIEYRH